jgi:hypothetical protein
VKRKTFKRYSVLQLPFHPSEKGREKERTNDCMLLFSDIKLNFDVRGKLRWP